RRKWNRAERDSGSSNGHGKIRFVVVATRLFKPDQVNQFSVDKIQNSLRRNVDRKSVRTEPAASQEAWQSHEVSKSFANSRQRPSTELYAIKQVERTSDRLITSL